MIMPIAPTERPVIFCLAPRKNKMQLTIALNMLSKSNLEKPYKLFLLGARENREIDAY